MENNVEVLLDSNEENAIKVDEQVADVEELDGRFGSHQRLMMRQRRRRRN